MIRKPKGVDDPEAARLLADYRARIERAPVYEVARITPLEAAPKLSARLGNTVLLKREDLQSVHSFKLRGAYNRIAGLSADQRARGVIAASAGNHAQGVALAAAKLKIPALIVMPRTTPQIKIESVRGFGARTVLHGDAYDEAAAHAGQLAAERGMVTIPPYDDVDVIAGQGTVGKEILEQCGERVPDAIFVCTGGGGLLAGVAVYVKSLHPEVAVISVEPDDSDCMARALAAGHPVTLPQVGLFADGVAVRRAGTEPFKLARRFVDSAITVSVDEICAAIRDIFNDCRAIAEPAGALAVAGAKRWVHEHGWRGRRLAAIVSGANVNFDRLRHIAERAELGDGRETLLAVTIPEQPGSFRRFLRQLGRRVITEFNYRYADPAQAHVFVGVHLDSPTARGEVITDLRQQGYAVADLSDDEMAKVHVRYMVGGRAPGLTDEHLFRFEFPERPGACLDFLQAVGSRWNISLFHYRNHGAAYGRVLCGLQVPQGQRAECRRALQALGYEWAEETDSPAYRMFLSAGPR
ncbi:MAG: threonine ammonia-lyase, biosynthetic [Gammaproteobacteria bacterium]|nr:threonine ammonia-lyase, biosynthetic [Gammaproteobacteria bacterium]